jgi:hypothetical protein
MTQENKGAKYMRATRAVACMLRASWSVIISSSRTVLHYPEGMTITITLRLVGSHHPAMLCLLLTMNTHNLRSHHVTCSTKCEANATTTRQPIKKAHGLLLCRFGSIMTRVTSSLSTHYYQASITLRASLRKHSLCRSRYYYFVTSFADSLPENHDSPLTCVDHHIFHPSTRCIGSVGTPVLPRSQRGGCEV